MTDAAEAAYPPARHVLRDLGLATETGPALRSRGSIAVGEHLRTPAGVVHAGAVATLVDALGGGLAAMAVHPDWMATADLTLHLLPRRDVAEVAAVGHVVRRGRTTVVVEVDLTASGAPLGLATMTFAVLARRDGNPVITQPGGVAAMTMAVPGSGFRAPLEESAGIVVIDGPSGTLDLPISEYVRNSLGAVQGGMMATLSAAASDRALTAASGATLATVDLEITYLSLAKSGPVRTVTTVLAASPDDGTARVALVDTGAEDRVTTIVRSRAVRVP
ncbi:MAG: hotdog domain-containing protein [Acidimicrobiia bacterium]